MRKNVFIAFLCVLFLSACQQEEWFNSEELKDNQVVFKLQCAEFEDENGLNRNGLERNVPYDRVEFCVADKQGYAVTSIKGVYDAASSELRFEGLQEGEYTLSIIGIKGDAQADGVTINPVVYISEPWLVFPSSLSKPLEADYFYSQTPFSVSKEWGKDGYETVVSAPSRIVQKHIVGRVDFSFAFNNRYIRTAVIGKKVQITARPTVQKTEEAMRLLRYTDFSLVTIAHRLGYNSQGHFTEKFKQNVGITPGKWRARLQSVPPEEFPRQTPSL